MPAKIKKVSAKASALPASTKKVVTKKVLVKKRTVKFSKAGSNLQAGKSASVMKVNEQTDVVDLPLKYVFIGVCRNCDHLPMGVNKLVAVLCIAIAILSGMLISTSIPINFHPPSISLNTMTDWITPASNVQNL